LWGLTPRIAAAVLRGAHRRVLDEHNDRAWMAWHVAALQRMKRMPRLGELLAREHKPQSTQDMVAMFEAITRMHGGTVH
jgi:hypothetical protein